MSEMIDLYGPGDYVYVRDHAGRVFVYIVRADGSAVLIQEPADKQ